MLGINEPRHEKTRYSPMRKTKAQISFAVTAKLICAFIFATQIVQFLYFLNQKFSVSSNLSVLEQAGLCQTWSETPKNGFLASRLKTNGILTKLFLKIYVFTVPEGRTHYIWTWTFSPTVLLRVPLSPSQLA